MALGDLGLHGIIVVRVFGVRVEHRSCVKGGNVWAGGFEAGNFYLFFSFLNVMDPYHAKLAF